MSIVTNTLVSSIKGPVISRMIRAGIPPITGGTVTHEGVKVTHLGRAVTHGMPTEDRYVYNFLEASNNRIVVPDLPPSATFSISCVFKSARTNAPATLWGGSYNNSVFLRSDGSRDDILALFIPKTNDEYIKLNITHTESLKTGKAHAITIERRGPTTYAAFIDGVEYILPEQPNAKPESFTGDFWIARSIYGGVGTAMQGFIYDVEIITAEGDNRFYKVNDGSGSVIADSVGGKNATLHNYSQSQWKVCSTCN